MHAVFAHCIAKSGICDLINLVAFGHIKMVQTIILIMLTLINISWSNFVLIKVMFYETLNYAIKNKPNFRVIFWKREKKG